MRNSESGLLQHAFALSDVVMQLQDLINLYEILINLYEILINLYEISNAQQPSVGSYMPLWLSLSLTCNFCK